MKGLLNENLDHRASTLVGYALINSCVQKLIHETILAKVARLAEIGQLDAQSRFCVGQKLIEVAYRGQGLVQAMDRILFLNCKNRYDWYIACAHQTNRASLGFLAKSGYEWMHEDGERHYFKKALAMDEDSGRAGYASMPTTPHVRLANQNDCTQLHTLNKSWTQAMRKGNKSEGFVGCLFTIDEFAQIIDRGEIVVVESQNGRLKGDLI